MKLKFFLFSNFKTKYWKIIGGKYDLKDDNINICFIYNNKEK